MKNLWLIGAVVFALESCGGPSVCDCVQWNKDYIKEETNADGADEKKAVKEKYKDKEEQCEKMYEEATKEEKKKMREEAEKC